MKNKNSSRRSTGELLLETLESRSLMSAPYDFVSVGIRYDGGASLFFAQGSIGVADDITGTAQFAGLSGPSSPQTIDWTRYHRGTGSNSGSFTFDTRDGFTPYSSQTGTRFIADERRDLGSFVGRDGDGVVRDIAVLLQPARDIYSQVTFENSLNKPLSLQMTRLNGTGGIEVFTLRIVPTLPGGNVPPTALVFSYELSTGTVTATRHMTGFENGVATLDGGERLSLNAARDVVLADFDGSDGIMGIASGQREAPTVRMLTQNGLYRAAVVVTGPASAAFFGVDSSELNPDGTGVANVVIRLHLGGADDSVLNTFEVFRQDEYDAGMRAIVNHGLWQRVTVSAPSPESGATRLVLTGQDSSFIHVRYAEPDFGYGRSLSFDDLRTQTDGHEELFGVASGSATSFNQQLADVQAHVDANGRPIAYMDQRNFTLTTSTVLYSIDLIDEAGGEAVVGDLITWRSANSIVFWAGLSASGDVQVWAFHSAIGATYINLTDALSGSHSIMGQLAFTTSSTESQQNQTLAGLDSDGHFVVYDQIDGHFGSLNTNWQFTDASASGFGGGATLPTFASDLQGWRSGWNAEHFAGLDSSGQIWAVWKAPELSQWQVSNISESVGMSAVSLVGNLSVVRTPWDTFHINGTDADGDLISTWWAAGFDSWHVNNLRDEFGGPALTPGTLTGNFSIGLQTMNYAGADSSGQAIVYWWNAQAGWNVSSLSSSVDSSDIPIGPWRLSATNWVRSPGVFGFPTEYNYSQFLLGSNADGHLVRLIWRSNEVNQWMLQDITATSQPYFL
ncbi:MAG: hypothetical protein H7210_10345 [Pyrinomonadaceae bacterium]|nr:hypothetical protein [Phycisphaerales bacterium]